MQALPHREGTLNKARRDPRVRISTPFICSLSSLGVRRWFRKPIADLGVVYDLSLRGIRMSTEAPIKPGDQISLTLRLPKDTSPAEVAVATVRWAKDQIYGLSFRRVSQSSWRLLTQYVDAETITKA
jgi:PilZ domain